MIAEWFIQEPFIAFDSRFDDIAQVRKLEDIPPSVFFVGELTPPKKILRNYMEVSIHPHTEVGILTNNVPVKKNWQYRFNEGELKTLPDGKTFSLGREPRIVEFLYKAKLCSTIKFFVEED